MTKLHHSPVETFKIPITLSMHPKVPPGLCSSAGSPGCQLLRQPLLPSCARWALLEATHPSRLLSALGAFAEAVACSRRAVRVLRTSAADSWMSRRFQPKDFPRRAPRPFARGAWRASRRRAPAAFLAFPAECTPLQRALLFAAARQTRHASLRAAAQCRTRLHPSPAAAQLRPYALSAVQLAQPVLPPRVAWRRGREARLSSGLAGLCPAGQPPRFSGPRAL